MFSKYFTNPTGWYEYEKGTFGWSLELFKKDEQMKPKKKSAPSKGKMIPDKKPENSYQKGAKRAVKSRNAGKREGC